MAKLTAKYFGDAIGFIRLARIDADNAAFVANSMLRNKTARLPSTPGTGVIFMSRHILLVKCTLETLEKYFKMLLLVSGKEDYIGVGRHNHRIRELWKISPNSIEFKNKNRIFPKKELKVFGIGRHRKGFDLIDIDYAQLRYEVTFPLFSQT